jgi:hypothetical protein
MNRDVDKAERDVNNAAKRTEDDAENAANKTGKETKDGVDKVGDKISEAAGNAAAEVNDQLYSGKMGPGDEKIYIDKHSKYYYINGEGKKVYVDKSQIRNKNPKD